jgi:hypothetical protein
MRSRLTEASGGVVNISFVSSIDLAVETDSRAERIEARLEVPMMIAALLVVPVIVIE